MHVRHLCCLLSLALGSCSEPEPTADYATGLALASADELRGVPLASMPYSGTELPSRVDLAPTLPPPGDQGAQNSCVGWTVAYALKTYQEREEEGWSLTRADGRVDPDRVFSPSFIYNQINKGRDGGSRFADALDVLSSQGAAPLSAMPYSADYLAQPSEEARKAARRYRIDTWRQVNVRDRREVKAQLNAGFPVVIGMLVDPSLERLAAGQTWRGYGGGPRSGHAMLVVGYDDGRQAFRVMNSWGTRWADGGFGWIDYGFFREAVNEGYVVRDAVNSGPVPEPTVTETDPLPVPIKPAPNPGPKVEPPAPNVPLPEPPPPPEIQLAVADVFHNVAVGMGLSGPGMRFEGTVRVPPGLTGTVQVVVRIYEARPGGGRGAPVGSTDYQFAMPDGQAATGTQVYFADGSGFESTWFAYLPYNALDVPRGLSMTPWGEMQGSPLQSDLVAETDVYVDDFGLGVGSRVPFWVRL